MKFLIALPLLINMAWANTISHPTCNIHIPASLAYKGKVQDKVRDIELRDTLERLGYNVNYSIFDKKTPGPELILSFRTSVIEAPAFLKKGIASLKLRMVDSKSRAETYLHQHGVSCKFTNKKDTRKYEKNCMDNLKFEALYLPECTII